MNLGNVRNGASLSSSEKWRISCLPQSGCLEKLVSCIQDRRLAMGNGPSKINHFLSLFCEGPKRTQADKTYTLLGFQLPQRQRVFSGWVKVTQCSHVSPGSTELGSDCETVSILGPKFLLKLYHFLVCMTNTTSGNIHVWSIITREREIEYNWVFREDSEFPLGFRVLSSWIHTYI